MFRDQRDVDRWYGRCPDCGDTIFWWGDECKRCTTPDREPEPPAESEGAEEINPDCPF